MPKLLIGTFQNNNYTDLLDIVKAGIDVGFTGFDTAPSYGTEKLLGMAIKDCAIEYNLGRYNFFISDKIDAWQMQAENGDVTRYVEDALLSMGMDFFDLLLIHWPVPEYMDKTWRCLEKLQVEGLAKNIGVCNVRVRHLNEMNDRGIFPEYVQIEKHPLRICSDEMEYCNEHGIKVMSYSPLCRMHPTVRESSLLKELCTKYGKNMGQIILRWHLETNATPVFMTKKASRIKENMEIFNFSLLKEEIEMINTLDQNYKIFLESWGCPGF